MRRRVLLAGLLVPVLLVLLGGAGLGCVSATPRAADLRGADGRLAPCPDSPNCVCSETPGDTEHAIARLSFRGPAPAAWAALLAVVAEWPRTHVVLQTTDYLHVEFTSLVFRFVDDVEFRLDAPASAIQVRAAPRVGDTAQGANRKRIEVLREAFAERLALGGAPGA